MLSQVEGMVLDAIADDFEELEEILKDVTRFGIKEGVHLEREMVVSALRHLVNSGLAFGYRLGFEPRPPIVSNIDWNDLDGLYFYVSTAGKGVIQEMSED